MRVAYRESVGEPRELDLKLEKAVGGHSLFVSLKMRIESTLDEVDATQLQKERFEQGDDFEMTKSSFNINAGAHDVLSQ